MALRIGTALRTAMVNAVTATIDSGSGPGKIRIYTGTQPATPATTASGTLLVEIPFADPSFAAGSAGSAAADVSPVLTGTAVATGTAGWFRILDSTDVAHIDGAVTATGGGGEITLASTAVSTALTVSVTSLTVTQPAS
jgi:hypothetical protein